MHRYSNVNEIRSPGGMNSNSHLQPHLYLQQCSFFFFFFFKNKSLNMQGLWQEDV